MALAVLSLLATAVYRIAQALMRESVYMKRAAEAQAIAEAGLEDAFQHLAQSSSWREGFRKKPFAGGHYTATVSLEDPPWVEVTGYSRPVAVFGPAVRTVRARVAWAWESAEDLAILANDVVLRSGARVDAAALGNGGSSKTSAAHIRSNGSLLVQKLADVAGKAYYKDASWVDGLAEGGVVRSSVTKALPDVGFSGVHDDATIELNDAAREAGSWRAASRDLILGEGEEARLAAGRYLYRDLHISSGVLTADTKDGTVTIYVEGTAFLGAKGRILNSSGVSQRLAIYGLGPGPILLNSEEPVAADIQAPQGRLVLGSQQVVQGRLIADQVDLSGILHFDHDLGRGRPVRIAWEPGTWSLSYKRQ